MVSVAGKKKMRAKIVVDPTAEMKKPVADWVKSTPLFVKKFKPVKFEDDVTLDPRKWSEKKLEKALYALVRYELQLFATQGANFKKDVDKKGTAGQQAAERQYPKLYDKLMKKAGDKISIALEEVEEDKGDNKKGLRDGKTALKKMADLDLGTIFSGPRSQIASAFKELSSALKDSGSGSGETSAFKKTEAFISGQDSEFGKDLKDAGAAVKFLLKTGTDIGKNKEAGVELKTFGASIAGYKKDLESFVTALNSFDKEVDEALKELKKYNMTSTDAAKMSRKFEAMKKFDRDSKKVEAALKKLQPEYVKVSKALK